jgi:hypothetical protein
VRFFKQVKQEHLLAVSDSSSALPAESETVKQFKDI